MFWPLTVFGYYTILYYDHRSGRPFGLLQTDHAFDIFQRWEQVERGRDRVAVLEVRYPQRTPRELPFHVGPFLLTQIKEISTSVLKWLADSVFRKLTEIIWYELDIMAMSMFSKTIMLITEYDPNSKRPQNLVKLLIPVRSNAIKSTRPKPAQKSDCDVSNML